METSNRVVCGMVLGEASESDEDSDVPNNSTVANISLVPSTGNNKKTPKHKLKYNTLLHYRLRDSNISLKNNMVNMAEQPVQKASQRLQESLQIQTRTRASLHEMPRYLHQLSVALVGLQDRLPTICNTKIIPESKDKSNEGEMSVWDRPWCLLDQKHPEAMAETIVCQSSESYCGIYYHEKQDDENNGATAIFVRGCQEDRRRPSLFIGNLQSMIYGTPTGRKFTVADPLRNTSHSYWAFDQACTTPLCNSWTDHTRQWGWINWIKEAYTFHCPGLPAQYSDRAVEKKTTNNS